MQVFFHENEEEFINISIFFTFIFFAVQYPIFMIDSAKAVTYNNIDTDPT